jgi:hypothetical protein
MSGRRFLAVFLLQPLMLAVSGCGTLYLHSDADQKAVENATTSLATSKNNHLAMLNAQSGVLAKYMIDQQRAVVEEEIAARNSQIVTLLDKKNEDLSTISSERLGKIVGVPLAPVAKGQAVNISETVDSLHKRKQEIQADKNRLISQALYKKVKIPQGPELEIYCAPAGGVFTPGRALTIDPNLVENCRALNESLLNYQRVRANQSFPASLLKNPKAGIQSGVFFDVMRKMKDIDEFTKVQSAVVAATNALLENAETHYADEIKKGEVPGIEIKVATTACIANRLFPPEAAASAVPNLNCGRIEALGFPKWLTELEKRDITFDNVQKSIKSVKSIFNKPEAIIAGSLDRAAADYAASKLGDILKAVATANTNPIEGEKDRSLPASGAATVVRLLGFLQDYQEAAEGKLPDVPAALIGLVRARMTAELAAAEIHQLQRARELVTFQQDAIFSEAVNLVAAREAASSNPDRALLYFAAAWSNGRVPYNVATWDLINLHYQSFIERESAVVKANYEVLEPGLDLLKRYAEGGYTPQDIAGFLQTIALFVIGARV